MPPVIYKDLGLMDYKQAWDLQESTLNDVIESGKNSGSGSNYLYFCEHPHVFTLGKSGIDQNLLITDEILKQIGATFYRINRGGDITYHGPGQLVGYPIFNLERIGVSLKEYIHRIEEAIIRTVADYGIVASRLEGGTGVWLDPRGKARK